MKLRSTALLLVAVSSMFVAFICGGSGSVDPTKYAGVVELATAQFFRQEQQGARLPQGINARPYGIQSTKVLKITSDEKKQSVKVRYCVEFKYTEKLTPFTAHVRVYIASLANGDWTVEAVKPDGTCDDVV